MGAISNYSTTAQATFVKYIIPEKLNAISKKKKWEDWITFFLEAVVEQARSNSEKASSILTLYNEMKLRIPDITHSQHAIRVLDLLFAKPLFNSLEFMTELDIAKTSAVRILSQLERNDIVSVLQKGKGTRPTLLRFDKLAQIVGQT